MKKYLSLALLTFTLLLLSSSCAWAQKSNNASSNSSDNALRKEIEGIKELLVKHYDPMIPIANYKPFVKARFEPIDFNSCNLRYKLIAPLDKNSSYILDVNMNLADLDPDNVIVSKDLKRENRWFISLQTLNMAQKIKVKYSTVTGTKVSNSGSFDPPVTGFDADGQDNAQTIADAFTSVIKQCSQK